MATFDDLHVGERFEGPTRAIGPEALKIVTGFGGYTHPLFTDVGNASRSTVFDRTPIPGALTLLIMGGLAEQTGVFDEDVLALIGLDEVRFLNPAFPGDTVALSIEVLAKRPSGSGRRGTAQFLWRCTNQHGDELVSAKATFLFLVGVP